MGVLRIPAAVLSVLLICYSVPVVASDADDTLGLQGVSNEEASAIRDVIVKQTDALQAGDLAGYSQYWMEGGVLMPVDHPRVNGRSRIVEFVKANYPAGTKVTFSNWDVAARDDLAVVALTASIAASADVAPRKTTQQIIVLRRQEDGAWRVQAAIWDFK